MSPYVETESKIVALAAAISGSTNPDEAIARALQAGLTPREIEQHLEAAMERDFRRRQMEARDARQ